MRSLVAQALAVTATAGWLGAWNVWRSSVTLPEAHPATSATAHAWPAAKDFFLYGTGLPDLWHPSKIAFGLDAVKHWYQTTDPMQSGLAMTFWVAVYAFVAGEITNNVSQIDRLWTFLPVIFNAHFALYPYLVGGATSKAFKAAGKIGGYDIPFLPDEIDARMALFLFLQIAWSSRLSYNAYRRGFFGSMSSEDYRWPILRQYIKPRIVFTLFDFFFIAFYQSYLLFATALPQYLLLTTSRVYHPTHAPVPLGVPDLIIAAIFLSTLVIEMIADNQQQAYQNFKHNPDWNKNLPKSETKLRKQEAARKRGFVTSGLWAWSRHPNFACEQATWWIGYTLTIRATLDTTTAQTLLKTFISAVQAQDREAIRAVAQTARPYLINYSIIGPFLMTTLFYASTLFTEWVSAGKYPLYASYKKRVSMFFPVVTLFGKIPWTIITGQKAKLDRDVFGVPAVYDKKQ